MPAVGEGAEGTGAHGVDNHDVPGLRRVRTESVFKQNHRIYFDSLIIAILNIAKKYNLINTLG